MDLKLCYNTFKFKEGESLIKTFTRYKALMNELVNDGIKLSKLEINAGFINVLLKKWLAFYQSLKNTNHVKNLSLLLYLDFQDSLDDKEDTRSSQEYMNDLEEEYQARSLLAKSKRFFKKGTQRHTKDFEAKLALLSSNASASSLSSDKNKGLITESYDWDEEEVSYDDNEVTKVKALMAFTDEKRVSIGNESARNGEWIKISMKK
nr:hypothetical protein [Tanacetum cinerariifolium]